MGEPVADTIYILLGLNAEGAIPAMELISCRGPDDAVARARAWLKSHATCVRVQVWVEDDTLLAELGREPADAI